MLLFKHLLIGTSSMSVIGVTGYGIYRAVEGYEEDDKKVVVPEVKKQDINNDEDKNRDLKSLINDSDIDNNEIVLAK